MTARAANGLLTAINPGTFDPVTLGHVDVIRRAAAIFDRVVVGVVRDPQHKRPLFSVEERVAFLEEALTDVPNAVVDVFSELVVDFARKHDAKTMVKGLRVIADFEWEFQMNRLNYLLAPEIETMYVMSSPEYALHLLERRQGDRLVRGQGGRARPARRSRAASGSSTRTAAPGR